MDPEETRMSAAAHHMVRNMTAGLSLITCREPLTISIQTNLKNAFMNTLRVCIEFLTKLQFPKMLYMIHIHNILKCKLYEASCHKYYMFVNLKKKREREKEKSCAIVAMQKYVSSYSKKNIPIQY